VEYARGKIIESISSGSEANDTYTVDVTFKPNLNALVSGKHGADAWWADIYAIYFDGVEDRAIKIRAQIQDCIFPGAYTSSGGWLTFMPYNLGADPNYSTPEAQMGYPPQDIYDPTVYGDLYQWGRPTDGHEKRNSDVTADLADSNTPGHSDFIKAPDNPYDWRNGSGNTDRWTDSGKAANDPCPNGYRVPSIAQWQSIFNDKSGDDAFSYGEVSNANTWYWQTTNGNIKTLGASNGGSLFLPAAGERGYTNGSMDGAGSYGCYWSSTVHSSTYAYYLVFTSSDVYFLSSLIRAYGLCVRCVAEQ
jgi:uncharacterized protein (TIGR02145 family)